MTPERLSFKRKVKAISRWHKNKMGWTFNRSKFVSDWMSDYDLGNINGRGACIETVYSLIARTHSNIKKTGP